MILERTEEAELAEAAIAQLSRGDGSAVLIEGPAGVGKTTILQLFADAADKAGVRALSGRPAQLESGEAWAGVKRLYDRVLQETEPEEAERLLGGAAANARPALGMEPATGEVIDPFTCVHGLYWLTANLTKEEPLLILVDDVQWLDEPSAKWLAHMVSRTGDLSLVLVLARRMGEPVAAPGPIAEIERLGELLRLRPRALSESACRNFVGRELGRSDDEVALACHRATGGNPLFLAELCRAIAASDAPPGAGEIEAFGAEGVARSVRQRLDRLPREASALAAALAVLGDRADLPEAAAMAGLRAAEAASAAHALAEVALIEDGYPLRFRHPILQSSLYESLDPGERSRRHREAAAELHERGGAPDRVASHLLRVDPLGDAWAVARLEEASRAASQRGANEVAAASLRRALREPPTERERPRLRFMHALAALGNGGPEAIGELTSAVRDLPRDERPRGALDASKVLGLLTEHEAALEICALGLQGEGVPPRIRSRLTDEMVVHMLPVDRTRWPELDPQRTYDEAPVPPDPGAAALREVSAALAATRNGEPVRVEEMRAAIPDLAGEFPTLAFVGGGFALIWSDELGPGLELADAALAYSRETGSPTGAAQWSTARASALLRLGRIREAVAEATASVEFNVDQAPSTLAWPLVPMIDGLLLLGDLEGAKRAAELLPMRPTGYLSVAMFTETLGRLALAEDQPDEAARHFADAGDRLTTMGYAGPPLSAWRAWLAIASARVGDPAAGLEPARAEIAAAERAKSTRVKGTAEIGVALCSPPAERVALLGESIDTLRNSPARIELCRGLAELGAELRRRGSTAEAREPLSEAVSLARSCGATALEEQARAELVAAGARPRRRALSGVEALTPSELRVAALVAEGRSNREVAQALFLSEKTVEGHLRGVFRKLDIGSRTEVADRLGDDPAPDPEAAEVGG